MTFKQRIQLQNLKQGEELRMLKSDFEGLEQGVNFPDLVIAKRHRYMGYAGGGEKLPFEIMHEIGAVDFYGYKATYEALGLYLFQLLFSQESYIHLKLTQPQTEIQDLFLHIDRTVVNDFFLKTAPLESLQYDYFREIVEKFPLSGNGFSDRRLAVEDCPIFFFGWSDVQKSYAQERIKYADRLILNVTTDGLCALATLFLDMAAPENKQDEICLEHPSLGFGGTGSNSLEARFWLPNSFGFHGDSLDNLWM